MLRKKRRELQICKEETETPKLRKNRRKIKNLYVSVVTEVEGNKKFHPPLLNLLVASTPFLCFRLNSPCSACKYLAFRMWRFDWVSHDQRLQMSSAAVFI